jgi:hypothetical protein
MKTLGWSGVLYQLHEFKVLHPVVFKYEYL